MGNRLSVWEATGEKLPIWVIRVTVLMFIGIESFDRRLKTG